MSKFITEISRCGRYFKVRHDSSKLYVRNNCTESSFQEKARSASSFKNNGEVEVTFSNRSVMKICSGKLAKLADGCATVTLHDTTVMATAMSKETTTGPSFVPLICSYQQKAAALGRIPLNFLRREIGVSEHEVLMSRVIDRSIRPLFPEGFNWETQIICNPLALDGSNFPDVIAINAASAALAISDIPWNGPLGAVRIGLVNNELLINPSKRELAESTLNLIVAAKSSKLLVMIEGCAKNILIQDLLKSLKLGVKECSKVVTGINNLTLACGKKKRAFEAPHVNPELKEEIEAMSASELKKIFQDFSHNKTSRDKAVSNLKDSVLKNLENKFPPQDLSKDGAEIFHKVCKNAFRDSIFETGLRCDGRNLEELREIHCEVDLYKPLHGSALFQRGQTQVMCTVALDSPTSALKMDRVTMVTSGLKEKNFFVHYEFPPFATREVGRIGLVGRREIGHGALAEKALKSNVPDNFPFTIRLTSEVLESNGSSSMATVCGGSLALLDAGVPLDSPCAGVAMGLISKNSATDPNYEFRILTDLMGIEDHFGDMDFKIAGTKRAITALQMDIKTEGVPMKVVVDILNQSRSATAEILKKMNEVCKSVRVKKKDNWPALKKVTVPTQARWKFLGPGGVNVKRLEMEFGVEITESDPGEFEIFASNKEALDEAEEFIQKLLQSWEEPKLEFGGVYSATITDIKDHGCMVTLFPKMHPVLIPTSQLDKKKVHHPSALGVEVGQVLQVKYFGRDPVSGTMRLSRKVLQGVTSEIIQTFVRRDTNEEGDQTVATSDEKRTERN